MKKVLAVVLASMMVLSLAACGGGDKKETEAPKETPKATEAAKETQAATEAAKETAEKATEAAPAANGEGLKIGVCIYKFDDNFMTLYRQELQKYLEETYGAEVTVVDGKGDQAEQTNQIDNFISQGVDVLILNLVQASATETVAKTCADAGIPAVFINREPDATELERWESEGVAATYVGADARQSGTFQGEIILDTPNKGDINGDGKVSYIMLIGDPENVDAQYRTEFSVKALTDAGMEVEELFAQRGDWDQAKGQELTANALAQFGDQIEVVFANNDAMALGAIEAIEAEDRKMNEDIYLVGVDALDEATAAIADGRMTGTVLNDHMGQSHTAADVAIKMANGEKVDTKYTVDYVKVTE
ncbi:MAG: substrate-binding domain-containing protein [Lachnospiraceae bacterium]|jgi:methyl-galactoside transport system substrate-binding protein|nr:substrate-binding domain-containing protein [Lachnospiraceae bacterium]